MKKPNTAAFSLVEVVLALGLAAFALLAIIGLLPVGVNTQQDSARETAAANLGTAIVSDLLQSTGTAATTARYKLNVSGSTTLWLNDSGASVAEAGAVYRATVLLRKPDDPRAATCGTVTIAWPAVKPSGSVTLFVSLDRN